MKFEKRREKFQEEVVKLMKKYQIELVPINMVVEGGEVLPAVKLINTSKEVETDEHTTKE